MWPEAKFLTLILFCGLYIVADGGFALVASLLTGTVISAWWLCAAGLMSIIAGLVIFYFRDAMAAVLIDLVGGWALASGMLHAVGAVALRKEIDHEWRLIAVGFFSIAFGILLAANPAIGAFAAIWVIGSYAVVNGILWAVLSLRLRTYRAQYP